MMLTYYNKKLCKEHWEQFCECQDKGKEDQARLKMGLKPRNFQKQEKLADLKRA